jgi:hypothetical protein
MSDAMKEIEKLRDFTEKRNPAHAVYARESMRRYTVKRRPIRTALDRALAEHGKAEAA